METDAKIDIQTYGKTDGHNWRNLEFGHLKQYKRGVQTPYAFGCSGHFSNVRHN